MGIGPRRAGRDKFPAAAVLAAPKAVATLLFLLWGNPNKQSFTVEELSENFIKQRIALGLQIGVIFPRADLRLRVNII